MISAVAHFAEDSGRDFAGEICVSCTVHEECFEGVSSREITRLAKRTLSSLAKRRPPLSRSAREGARRWLWKQRG